MCSIGVFLGVCPFIFIKRTSICNGELLRRRTKSVSVVILRGIRLRTTTRSGRMSCDEARRESMTKICSFFSSSIAGRFFCKFKGIAVSYELWIMSYELLRPQLGTHNS